MQRLFDEAANTHVVLFDSVGEVAEITAERMKLPEIQSNVRYAGLEIEDSSWIGHRFNSWNDVLPTVNKPWDEGLGIVDRMLAEMNDCDLPQPKTRRRRMRWRDDDGDEFDRERLLATRPYWLASQREVVNGPTTATIVSDVSASAFRDPSDILWRGAAALCLCNLLESAGYRTELWVIDHRTYQPFANTQANYSGAVNVKRSQDPLDMTSLVTAVSGWFFRAVLLPSCLVAEEKSRLAPGAGVPTNIDPMRKHITTDENVIVVKDIWDKQAAIAWVRKKIEAFNASGTDELRRWAATSMLVSQEN